MAITAEDLISMCFRDRFSLIVPYGMEDCTLSLLDKIMVQAKVTGVLQQCYGAIKLYHCTTKQSAKDIVNNGFKPVKGDDPRADNLSFGGDVVYSFEEPEVFGNLTDPDLCILEVDYKGPYLKALAEQDKPEHVQGVILFYPCCVKDVQILTECTSEFLY